MSFPVEAFPPAELVDREDGFVQEQSDWTRGMLQTRTPDTEVLTDVWSLTWRDVPGVIGLAIRQHYEAFHNVAWDWTHPQESAPRKVVYLEAPAIAWTNENRIAARVILGAAAAHE